MIGKKQFLGLCFFFAMFTQYGFAQQPVTLLKRTNK